MMIIDYSKFDATPLAKEHGWDGAEPLDAWCQERLATLLQGFIVTSRDAARSFVRGLPDRLTRHGGLPDIKKAASPMVATWAFAMTDRHAFRMVTTEHWALHNLANQPFEPANAVAKNPEKKDVEAA